MPSLSPHLIRSKCHIRCARTSSSGRQGYIINHAFTIAHHSLQSSFLALQTFLFQLTLFSQHPSIPFVAFLSTSHLSHQILLFSSPTSLPPFSPCVQIISTHCSARPVNTFVTTVLLCISSFHFRSIHYTPRIFLKHHLRYIQSNDNTDINNYYYYYLYSRVLSPYRRVAKIRHTRVHGDITLSPLFTFFS